VKLGTFAHLHWSTCTKPGKYQNVNDHNIVNSSNVVNDQIVVNCPNVVKHPTVVNCPYKLAECSKLFGSFTIFGQCIACFYRIFHTYNLYIKYNLYNVSIYSISNTHLL
jgi:hypothetical protein